MVKIQFLSDLHLEFGNKITRIGDCESSILVIAGDLTVGYETIRELIKIKDNVKKPIVFVPGNHEYYGYSKKEIDKWFKLHEKRLDSQDIFILNNRTVEIFDITFIGSTGWWDSLYNPDLKGYLNDFNLISDIDGTKWGEDSRWFFETELEKHQGKKIVCISHNNPTLVTPLKFVGSRLNVFFNNDWKDLIENYQPNYWIFGHTHESMVYNIGKTICMCNPMGYPTEINSFSMMKTFEI